MIYIMFSILNYLNSLKKIKVLFFHNMILIFLQILFQKLRILNYEILKFAKSSDF